MATESDLRDLLQHPDPEGRGAIDVDAVLRRARRRRRPRVIAAQALGSVAVVGVLGTAIFVAQPPAQEAAMIAQDTAAGTGANESQPFADEDGMLKAAECGEAPVIPPLLGWTVDITPAPAVDPEGLGVSVTLGREGTVPESGTVAIDIVTVIDDGIVVGHASPAFASVPVGPGAGEPAAWEPVTWTATAPVVSCDVESPLPAGTYQAVVRMTYVADGGDGFGEPIWSEPVAIEIG